MPATDTPMVETPSTQPSATVTFEQKPAQVKSKKHNLKKSKKRAREAFAAVFIIFLLIFALLSASVYGIVNIIYNSAADTSNLYSLKFVKNGSTQTTISSSSANNVYGLYVPYSAIALIADISIVGDDQKANLICLPSESMLTCKHNSTLIYVNGSAARLSVPVIFVEDDFLLPIEIFENYVFGIDIVYNDKTKVCTLSRTANSPDLRLKMAPTAELTKTDFPESYKLYE